MPIRMTLDKSFKICRHYNYISTPSDDMPLEIILMPWMECAVIEIGQEIPVRVPHPLAIQTRLVRLVCLWDLTYIKLVNTLHHLNFVTIVTSKAIMPSCAACAVKQQEYQRFLVRQK